MFGIRKKLLRKIRWKGIRIVGFENLKRKGIKWKIIEKTGRNLKYF